MERASLSLRLLARDVPLGEKHGAAALKEQRCARLVGTALGRLVVNF
jgi:hypothetical protein